MIKENIKGSVGEKIMSTVSWQYKGMVSAKYNDRDLSLVSKNGQLDWNQYPVQLSEAQYSAIPNVSMVLDILFDGVLSPINMSEDKNSEFIRSIQEIYEQAMEKYKNDLKKANQLDQLVIRDKNRYSDNFFVGWFQYFARLINGHHQRVLNDGSAHRLVWMASVGALEEQRQKNMKEQVEYRCKTLMRSIEEDRQDGLIALKEVEELKSLVNFFERAFFNQSEDVESMKDIKTFLAEISPIEQ